MQSLRGNDANKEAKEKIKEHAETQDFEHIKCAGVKAKTGFPLKTDKQATKESAAQDKKINKQAEVAVSDLTLGAGFVT